MKGYIGPEKIIDKKKEYMIPCVYHFYQEPVQMVKGEGKYLYDHQGKSYLDFFAGVSVVAAGHCHPEITDRICEQVKTLQHTTTVYLTQPIVDLAEKLAQVTPGKLKKSFFCSSGTEANEGAALLAKLHTGSSEFISLRMGLHGRTHLTMSLTGLTFWRTDPTPVGGISFAPNAYCYRCPFEGTYPNCDLECAKQVEFIIQTSTSGKLAAMFAEPIQGNGGIITPPPGYFERVKEILDRYGALLIVDEIQTGFGRTGKMFAIENWEVSPQIMTVAKALANGTPVGAFIAESEVAECYTRPGASTLGGNPVTAVAALATLEVIEKEKLVDNAAKVGHYFKEKLMELKEEHELIGDVRGIGLMLGAELVREGKEPAVEETDRVLEALKNNGVLIGKNGHNRNVLAFQPPLIITKADVDQVIHELGSALSQI
ncbi:aspartate aminotransferase family protein [Candidatus Contubernalis alkaliaceticus]|uniref:aspartate aminotransferase family protein n=1 Tax=Candidatus Contubernalis alkaliaceticus TaxID=338645 RepID=UPI001F4C208C|nr:aspartate aminotransferase family protein [Candidatus Contubernalis alkalaceticus]UNC92797.1 aspartate aminotransferase family protein [Candidatus Contubernalis alkalaceticus]